MKCEGYALFLARALTAFMLLFCAACSKPPALAPLPADAVVLAFGDSLTAGTGAAEAESYPAVLATLIGRKVVNAGIPGELSAEGAARLPELLEREKPALLLLCHGGNDLLQKQDTGRLAENLRTMIRTAREKGVAVVLLAVPAPDLSLSPPPLYEEVAREFAVPLEGKALAKILSKHSLKSDYIHPNAAGYKQLAAAVAALLKKSGAI
jgi:lysophospholipase L1-like esterase